MHGPGLNSNINGEATASQEPGILHVLWKRKFLIIVVGLMGLGGGYLRFLQQKPVYQSRARVVLHTRRYDLPMNGINNAPTATDSLHETLLRSPLIADLAIKEHRLDTLPSLRGGDPASQIVNNLSVVSTVERTGSILDFSYRGPQPKDCKEILAGVIDAYEKYLDANYKSLSEETLLLIREARDSLDERITTEQIKYEEFLQTTPLLKMGATAINVYEQRLMEIEQERARIMLQMSQLKARMTAITMALKAGNAREALTLLVRNNLETTRKRSTELQEVERVNMMDAKLLPLMIEEETLLETYAENHPRIKRIRLQINAWREMLMNQPITGEDGSDTDFFQVYLQSLEQELAILQQQSDEFQTLFEEQRRLAKELQDDQQTDAKFKSELARLGQLYQAVIDRLEEIDLVKDNMINIAVVNPASNGVRVSPNLKSDLSFGGMLGLLAGCALAYLINIADKRFRNPEDVRNYLGLPVVGHVPVFRAGNRDVNSKFAGIDPALRVIHEPNSSVAEAYRAVRTSLYFSASGKSHKIVQVTSPHPGDGKTTSAANLAASIAASGTRVLLVDCDMRRPRCHRLFGCENQEGVSSVVRGEGNLLDAIQVTNVPNLQLLTSGPAVDTPAELLTHPNFAHMLDVLRERYDLVILDSPPLLAVTDATVIAPRVDGVLLVMRLSRSARESGKRATELLNGLGASVVGVIINGVGQGDYAYYGQSYSEYGYYGYGYGYGYAQGEVDIEKAESPTARPRIGV